MQFYGFPHSLMYYFVIILIGASILVAFIIYNGHKKIQLNKRVCIVILLRVLLLVIFWQVTFFAMFYLIYTGGTLEFIRLTENIANLISFVIILAITYFVEHKLLEEKRSDIQ